MFAKPIDRSKMKHPVMLYKHPGAYAMHKNYYDYTIVDKAGDDYDAALKANWYTSTTEALKHSTAKKESKLSQKDVLKAQADALSAKQETEKALVVTIKAQEESEKLKKELEELRKAKDPIKDAQARRQGNK